MANVLIIAEHLNGKLNSSTAKCVTAAKKIPSSTIDIAIFAAEPTSVAEQAAKIDGVNKVLTITHASNGHAIAAILAPQIVALASNYSHVLGPSTTFGKDLLPRVAALLGEAMATDIMNVIDAHTFERPVYAGNAIITVKTPADRKLIGTVRNASFAAAAMTGGAAIEAINVTADLPGHTRFVELQAGAQDRPDLQSASRVVSGGRALGSGEAFSLIYALADKLGAAVGASRAAVDAGYVASDLQVGQTGKIIAPELYVAVGISGAIQHLTGIKDAGTIIAINKDSEAPIFEIADFGLVGDLFKLLPELTQSLP